MFETFMEIINHLTYSADVTISYILNNGVFMNEDDDFKADNEYHITLENFDGFDNHWNEIHRSYENPKMVRKLFDFLETASVIDRDFYTTYYFNDFSVVVGYASDNI